ncbi:hypothetical protein BP5796_01001 [Coleophoma crateriformis]|uniref:Uncharacterized protein n=1 Tax=Coleophoma crateriformis TaxID=565419 RepID=A0A3D8TC27_9HELO|nr:hypothetical protein BP5796_01001 [Coleophoma crateriformis]
MSSRFPLQRRPYLVNIIFIPHARLPAVPPRPRRIQRRRAPMGSYFRTQAAFYSSRPVGADPYEHQDAVEDEDPYSWDEEESQREDFPGGILSLFMHILQFIARTLSGIIGLLVLRLGPHLLGLPGGMGLFVPSGNGMVWEPAIVLARRRAGVCAYF